MTTKSAPYYWLDSYRMKRCEFQRDHDVRLLRGES